MFWHQIRVRPRLVTSAAIGVLALAIFPAEYSNSTRALISWDLGAGLYLALAWIMFGRASVENMKRRARLQDDGAAVVLFLTVLAAVASIAAILLELSDLKSLPFSQQSAHVSLVAVTFLASWFLVHTSFALHYAHAYYVSPGVESSPPLSFPCQEKPLYIDFIYFAMVIGMTSQTSDVSINSTRMRRLAMAHGIIAFVFNTTLLALTINMVATLLG